MKKIFKKSLIFAFVIFLFVSSAESTVWKVWFNTNYAQKFGTKLTKGEIDFFNNYLGVMANATSRFLITLTDKSARSTYYVGNARPLILEDNLPYLSRDPITALNMLYWQPYKGYNILYVNQRDTDEFQTYFQRSFILKYLLKEAQVYMKNNESSAYVLNLPLPSSSDSKNVLVPGSMSGDAEAFVYLLLGFAGVNYTIANPHVELINSDFGVDFSADSIRGWALKGGVNLTVSHDRIEGSGSVEGTFINATSFSGIVARFSKPLDLTDMKFIRFYLKTDNNKDLIRPLVVFESSSGYFQVNLDKPNANEWTEYTVGKDQANEVGSPTWSDIHAIRFGMDLHKPANYHLLLDGLTIYVLTLKDLSKYYDMLLQSATTLIFVPNPSFDIPQNDLQGVMMKNKTVIVLDLDNNPSLIDHFFSKNFSAVPKIRADFINTINRTMVLDPPIDVEYLEPKDKIKVLAWYSNVDGQATPYALQEVTEKGTIIYVRLKPIFYQWVQEGRKIHTIAKELLNMVRLKGDHLQVGSFLLDAYFSDASFEGNVTVRTSYLSIGLAKRTILRIFTERGVQYFDSAKTLTVSSRSILDMSTSRLHLYGLKGLLSYLEITDDFTVDSNDMLVSVILENGTIINISGVKKIFSYHEDMMSQAPVSYIHVAVARQIELINIGSSELHNILVFKPVGNTRYAKSDVLQIDGYLRTTVLWSSEWVLVKALEIDGSTKRFPPLFQNPEFDSIVRNLPLISTIFVLMFGLFVVFNMKSHTKIKLRIKFGLRITANFLSSSIGIAFYPYFLNRLLKKIA